MRVRFWLRVRFRVRAVSMDLACVNVRLGLRLELGLGLGLWLGVWLMLGLG